MKQLSEICIKHNPLFYSITLSKIPKNFSPSFIYRYILYKATPAFALKIENLSFQSILTLKRIVHSQNLYFLTFINLFVRMLQCKETLIFMTSFKKYCQKYFSKIEIFPYCLHCPSSSSNIIHALKCGLQTNCI